ncbi:hypothetical protein CR205_02780 [Alteribacter lacisalsi]|uniref:Carboxypeptidase regulatory-like domain-containing protein n=1 Tax=Alteribacter lacisalsi TaxID=2045244 RepID=A0A2W0HV37_9BACI|nr:carboxypeptidase-like regulatory domain-containing protein [Alteribacter lacisalsi]PYZ97538.1 hypothetical protein CR205_02780 [Alteribacter lacisalsi]
MNGWMKNVLLVVLLAAVTGGLTFAVKAESSQEPVSGIQITEGVLKEGIQDLRHTPILIQSETNPSEMYQMMTDQMGHFYGDFPDGDYKLKGLSIGNQWYSSGQTFNVEEGMIGDSRAGSVSETEKQKVTVPDFKGKKNVSGRLTEGSSGLKGDILLATISGPDEEIVSLSANGKGQFSAAMPNGTYYLFGVSSDSGFYALDQYVIVKGTTLYVDGKKTDSLNINLPERAFKGNASDSTTPLAKAAVVISKITKHYDYEFVEYTYTDRNGDFQIRGLKDGSYSMSVYHDTYFSWEQLSFEVSGGKLIIDGDETGNLNFKVPDLTLKGTLLDAGKPLGHAYLEIENRGDEDDWYDYFTVPVDKKGQFAYRLPDDSYSVVYVEERERHTPVNISFDIENGKIVQDGSVKDSLDIHLPPLTFTGRLHDQGQPLRGQVSVERDFGWEYDEDDEYDYDFEYDYDYDYEWYSAHTNKDGVFSMRLKDGEYLVSWVYLSDEQEDIYLYEPFEIKDGKLYVDGKEQSVYDIAVPPVSFHGVALDNGTPVTEGEVLVVSDEGDYHWKWIYGGDGTFSMRLKDGGYKVKEMHVAKDGTTAYLHVPFEIRGGQLTVDGQAIDKLEFNIPQVTVTGKLLADGKPVEGEIMITDVNDEEGMHHIWAWTNGSQGFSLRLADGDYVAEEGYLFDGTSFVADQPFSVINGQLMIDGVAADSLDITVPPVTLSGKATYDGNPIEEGHVSIVSNSSDDSWPRYYDSWIENGRYQFRLVDGEYRVESMSSWDAGYAQFDIEFTIEGGQLYVDGEKQDSLDLELNDGTMLDEFYWEWDEAWDDDSYEEIVEEMADDMDE